MKVVEVARYGSGPPTLLVEVPHGATKRAHFDATKALLKGPFPDSLVDFFFVNTDVGAPEAAHALARAHGDAIVVRCLIPRTFIDCNRVIDAASRPTTSQAGGMTPGVVEYVREEADLATLFALYRRYRDVVDAAFHEVCGGGGFAVMLHSYAPRSIDVPVDADIVRRLREAYDRIDTWPLRPEVDFITTTPDGRRLVDDEVAAATRRAFAAEGLTVGDGASYPLHPSTSAYAYAERWPTSTLCLEVRRDLLVRRFTPFDEMTASRAKVERIGRALARGLSSRRRSA